MKRYNPPRSGLEPPTFLPATTEAVTTTSTSTGNKPSLGDDSSDLIDPSAASTRQVVVQRQEKGGSFGFLLKRNRFPLVIGQADENVNLAVGQTIISINGRRLKSFDEALEIIAGAGDELHMLITPAPGSATMSSAQPSAKPAATKVTPSSETAHNLDVVLKHIPRVVPSAIYDRQNCPFTPADGITESFHDKLQDFITMRALGAYGTSDRVAVLQGRGHVRSTEELVQFIGSKGGELVKQRAPVENQTELQRAARQQNTLCALLDDLKRARDERWKDDAANLAQRRNQAMENLKVVQKLADEETGVGNSSLNPVVVGPAPPPPFSQQQHVLSMIQNYYGQQLSVPVNVANKRERNFPRNSGGRDSRNKKRK